jgi:hypothetical protein
MCSLSIALLLAEGIAYANTSISVDSIDELVSACRLASV